MAARERHSGEGALVTAGLMLVAALVSAVVACCLLFQAGDSRALAVEIGPQGGSREVAATASAPAAAQDAAAASPGTLVRDGEGVVWTAATASGELFHVRYAGPDGKTITVESGNGDKMVAPGTENTYRFSAENKMDETVDYTIQAIVDVSEPDVELPLEGRVRSASGYLSGDDDTWVPLSEMGVLEDGAKLGARQTADYSIEWRWPFERGEGDELASNDAEDTALGNREADVKQKDIKADVTLRVMASYDGKASNTTGPGDAGLDGPGSTGTRPGAFGLPKTGDTLLLQIGFFALAAALALGAVVVLLASRPRKERDRDDD